MDPHEFLALLEHLVKDGAFAGWFVYRGNLDRTEAEELAQETLARAWFGRAGFDPDKGTLREWVFGIQRRVLAQYLGNRRGRRSSINGQDEDPPDDGVGDPADLVVLRELEEAAVLSTPLVRAMEKNWRRYVIVGLQPHVQNRVVASCLDLLKGFVGSKWLPPEYHGLLTMQVGIAPRLLLARARFVSAGHMRLLKSHPCPTSLPWSQRKAWNRTRRGLAELGLGGADRRELCRRYGLRGLSHWVTRYGDHLQNLNLVSVAQRAWGHVSRGA